MQMMLARDNLVGLIEVDESFGSVADNQNKNNSWNDNNNNNNLRQITETRTAEVTIS